MRLIRQHNIINGVLLMAAVSVSSCDSILEDDSLPVSNENIEISFTRSSENTVSLNDNGTFKVAFFTGVNYNFYAATDNLSGIDNYKENAYDTAIPYPNGTAVYAVGYAPSNLLTASDDYKQLTLVSTVSAGTVDVLASQTETGSKSSPFSVRSPLQFQHLLTKITFIAKRDKKMQSSKLVHDVKVTLGTSYLINKWEYDNQGTYMVAGTQEKMENLTLHVPDQYLTDIDTEYIVGTCYLNMPAHNDGKLSFNLEATLTPVGSTDDIEADYGEMNIQLLEANNQIPVSTAQAGEAYEVVINFTQDSFTLTGVKAPWKTGGLITVPINPTNN